MAATNTITDKIIEDHITAELIRQLLRNKEREERNDHSLEVRESDHPKVIRKHGQISPLDLSIEPIEPKQLKSLRKAYRDPKPLRSATISENDSEKYIAIEYMREINGKMVRGALWLAPYLTFNANGNQYVIDTKKVRHLLYDHIHDSVFKPLPNGLSIQGIMDKQILLDHSEPY